MTPAERLLAAADLLDKRAGLATGGPWGIKDEIDGMLAGQATVLAAQGKRVVTVGQTRPHHYDAAPANIAYIATMHPEVGKAVAAWLRTMASLEAAFELHSINDNRMLAGALTVADLLLAGSS